MKQSITKYLGLAVTGAIMATASAALADGMAKRGGSIKDAPMAAPFSWTGFYVGANVGGAWVSDDARGVAADDATSTRIEALANAGLLSRNFGGDGAGAIFGVQAGYNHQMQGVVIGFESDFQGSTAGSSSNTRLTGTIPGDGAGFVDYTYNSNLEWFGTVRGRLGVLMSPTLLAYVTGGFAYGLVERSFGVAAVGTGANSFNTFGRNKSLDTGWTVGGGLEAALGGGFSVAAEYLYLDLGGNSFRTTNFGGGGAIACGAANCNVNVRGGDVETHLARLKLNYKF